VSAIAANGKPQFATANMNMTCKNESKHSCQIHITSCTLLDNCNPSSIRKLAVLRTTCRMTSVYKEKTTSYVKKDYSQYDIKQEPPNIGLVVEIFIFNNVYSSVEIILRECKRSSLSTHEACLHIMHFKYCTH
jgi:hypothetical protein